MPIPKKWNVKSTHGKKSSKNTRNLIPTPLAQTINPMQPSKPVVPNGRPLADGERRVTVTIFVRPSLLSLLDAWVLREKQSGISSSSRGRILEKWLEEKKAQVRA